MGSKGNKKVYTFAAGPAKLPESVLQIAQHEMLDYKGHGISVMEMSHRSPEFVDILRNARTRLRSIMNVPDTHEILFMQAGGTGQFAAVPLNLLGRTGSADYLITGGWSAKAEEEARKFGKTHVVLKPDKFNHIPSHEKWKFSSEPPSYVYYCDNETVHGVEFATVPEIPFDSQTCPLVADMSSNLLTRPVDVSKFGLIFASAQKNIGCAGITVVIVRKDLLGKFYADPSGCPSVFDYKVLADNESNYNTPPCFSLYVMGLVFEWIEQCGGLSKISELNARKSAALYDAIDNSNGFYWSVVDKEYRSRVNVPFCIGSKKGDEVLEKKFLHEAHHQWDLIELKGHRSVGGIRASIYNAMSLEGVGKLCEFMKEFRERNQKK